MSVSTTIEWTNATWNPVRGCAIVSKGCTNCYAMRQAHRQSAPGRAYAGLTTLTKGGPVWTGKVRLVPELLDQPLRWRKPRRIFVNSMSDLFHEDVPDDFIAQVWFTMASAQRHTFQILTKRPERMLQWISRHGQAAVFAGETPEWQDAMKRHGWPLRNVWLGVSVENQPSADERIPLLLATPAAVWWISAEPLIGPIDIIPYLQIGTRVAGTVRSDIRWVVAGGESGPGARPMHPDWARSVRDQCAAAGVPFFFKQWGAWAPDYAFVRAANVDPATGGRTNPNAHMGPRGLAVQGVDTMFHRGKKAAGRILDGRTHDDYPC